MATSHWIYQAAGSPIDVEWEGDVSGCCRLCGAEGLGRPWEKWVKPTFTDHDLLVPGSIICTACLFCAQERTQWLAERTGRDKPQRMRTYSHIVLGGEWHVLSKGDKRAMRDLLMLSPEVAIISDSGQKHLIFRARPGWWQFELAAPVVPDAVLLQSMLRTTDELYLLGASKQEIETGRYSQRSIMAIGPARWRTLDREVAHHRGTAMLQLAVFLTLKPQGTEDGHDDGDPQPAADEHGQFLLV